MRNELRGVVIGLTVAATLGLSACGSGDDTKASDPAGAAKPAVSTAGKVDVSTAFKAITGLDALTGPATADDLATRVAQYQATPKALLQTKKVKAKAAAGKTVALLVCGVPVCTEFNKAAKEAADLLGWKTERIDMGISPEDFVSAYNRAIELKPDLVVGSGLPRELFAKQLDTLATMNIPVIEWSSGIEPVDGKLWVATDNPQYEASGAMSAELVAADGKLDTDVVVFNVKQYSMSTLFATSFRDYLGTICDKCGVDYQEVAATDIGKLGQKVTGYVQRKPDTKYVVCSFGDLCQGVGQALKAAGRSDVKVFTRDPGATNYQNIANGLEWATSPLPIGQTGWQIIDLAQRIFSGEDTEGTRLQPAQLVTSVPDPKSTVIGAVPDYQAQYKALWQLEG